MFNILANYMTKGTAFSVQSATHLFFSIAAYNWVKRLQGKKQYT